MKKTLLSALLLICITLPVKANQQVTSRNLMIYTSAAVVTVAAFMGLTAATYLLLEKSVLEKSMSKIRGSVDDLTDKQMGFKELTNTNIGILSKNIGALSNDSAELKKINTNLETVCLKLGGRVEGLDKRIEDLTNKHEDLLNQVKRLHGIDPMVFQGIPELTPLQAVSPKPAVEEKTQPLSSSDKSDSDDKSEVDTDDDDSKEVTEKAVSPLKEKIAELESQLADLSTQVVGYKSNTDKGLRSIAQLADQNNRWIQSFVQTFNDRYKMNAKHRMIYRAPTLESIMFDSGY